MLAVGRADCGSKPCGCSSSARSGGAGVRVDRAERRGRRRDLPPPGRHSAGDRARRGARARAVVEDIAARLSDRFQLLSRGDRTALPRQQTLRALIDWSHDLLSEPERTLLRRLAVFAGGWTLAAAEAIAAGGDVDQADVFDLQSQLVDKSLVAMAAEGGRYRLLDTVRDYAANASTTRATAARCASATSTTSLRLPRGAHASFGAGGGHLASAARRRAREPPDGARVGRSGRRAGDGAAARIGAQAVSVQSRHARIRVPDHRRIARAHSGARSVGGALSRLVRCRADLLLHGPLRDAGDTWRKASQSRARSAIPAHRARAAAARPFLCGAGESRGGARSSRGSAHAGALARRQAPGGGAFNALGQLRRVEGALDESEPMYAQVLALAHEIGDRETVAIGLLNLAMVDVERGTTESARRRLVDVLRIADEIGSKPAGQSVVEVCAGMAALEGDWLRAARFFGAAEEQTSHTGITAIPLTRPTSGP